VVHFQLSLQYAVRDIVNHREDARRYGCNGLAMRLKYVRRGEPNGDDASRIERLACHEDDSHVLVQSLWAWLMALARILPTSQRLRE